MMTRSTPSASTASAAPSVPFSPASSPTPAVNSVVGAQLKDVNGAALVVEQLKAVGLTIVWSVVATAIIAYIVKAVIGLRPTPWRSERQGLDLNEHGEEGYVYESKS
jgi:Amt family ammonium transporter